MNERSKERMARLSEVERELARLKKKCRTLEREYPRDISEEYPEPRRSSPAGASEPERAPANVPERAVAGKDGDQRERFASYFMTGSLGRAAPQLRKERRAMRNKAILMAAVALFFLIVLAYFLLK